jgi:predicted ABC-type ATPase
MKFRDFLQEQKEKHAVMAFGRMNPITVGHEKLVNKVKDIADKVGGTAHIVVSHSQDSKKNPLTSAQKVKHAKRAFPGVNVSASSPDAPNFLAQAAKLHKQGVTHLHMVGGQDRVGEFHKLLHKYNGVKGPHGSYNFKKIEVHSAGDRDPDAEGVEGMSASKMREHASKGNFKKFRSGVPSTMSDQHAKEMYDHVRKGMKIDEDVDFDFEELLTEGVNDKSIFKAVFLAGGPGSGKDYVLDNTLAGHGLTEINSDKALEFLMDKEGLDAQMPEGEKEARDFVRGRAKNITELKQRLALTGRNGLIVNGTGDDYEKVKRIKTALENLGYDTSMVMVNTEDEVSAQRNIERGKRGGRTVPENIRREKWEAVQNARPELAKLFGDRYSEYENSEDLRTAAPEVVKAKKDEMLELYKGVKEFIAQQPASPAAEEWIAKEMQSADRLPVPKSGAEMTPHPESGAANEAKEMGLQYYGFGRYGRNGKVTHRSVHDRLVEVQKYQQDTPDVPVSGSSMKKNKDSDFDKIFKEEVSIDEEFEEVFTEDLRKWFSKTDPAGDWKRINSKGEAIGPCAREPGEPKPKCMSRAKRESLTKQERASAVRAKRKHDPNPERQGEPINVSNYGKGKLSEEKKEANLFKDSDGKVRIFMLRRAAAKEAHTTNGTVMPYKNGYAVKLKEENNHVQSTNQLSEIETKNHRINEGVAELTTGQEYARGEGITGPSNISTQETGSSRQKITLGQIRTKQKEKVKESIDKGIEPGLSMATGGENLTRGSTVKNKQIKKPFEEMIGAGGEDATSMSDFNDNVLKQKGINIKTFKAKRPI